MKPEDKALLNQILTELRELKSIILSEKTNEEWADEKTASAMLGYKNVRTLRKKVKAGTLAIDYTLADNIYQYSRKSISKHLLSHSTIIKLKCGSASAQ